MFGIYVLSKATEKPVMAGKALDLSSFGYFQVNFTRGLNNVQANFFADMAGVCFWRARARNVDVWMSRVREPPVFGSNILCGEKKRCLIAMLRDFCSVVQQKKS